METLSNYLQMEITGFLSPVEALNFAATSKTIKADLDLAIIDDTFSHPQLTDQHWSGSYDRGGETQIWFRFTPCLFQDRIHSIRFIADCVDQGWGNRKSRLSIHEEDENVDHRVGKCVATSHLLEHHSTSVKFEFQPKSDKNYLMCYTVGGGGGHELFVKNPQIRVLTQNSKGIGRVTSIFQDKDIQLILNTSFGVNMMLGIVDSLKNSIEREQEQDEHLASRFSSIGVDTTDKMMLNGMKDFLTEIIRIEFPRRVRTMHRENIDPENRRGSDFEFDESDYSGTY